MSRVVFPSKRVGETRTYAFDFTPILPPGVTISIAAATMTLYSGTDANPSAMLSGAAAIAGLTASQDVTAGVAGNIYVIQMQITTSTAKVYQMTGFIAVLPSMP